MKLNVILRVLACVLIGMTLGSMFVLLACLIGKENTGEPDEQSHADYWKTSDVPEYLWYFDGEKDFRYTFDGVDITIKDEDLLWDGGLTDNDNVLAFTVVRSEIEFSEGVLIMTDDAYKHESRKTIIELLRCLPDNIRSDGGDPSWEWCWDALGADAQDEVEAVRKKAREFLKE